jgi:hypothetical protein
VSFALTCAVFVGPLFHPLIRDYAVQYYNRNFGQTVAVLYEISKPDIDSAVAFAQKVGGLLLGWFGLLFAVELLLRLVLLVVGLSIRAVLGCFATAAPVDVVVTEGKKVN